jgi:hypothetical protein
MPNLSTGLAYADDVCGDDAKITWTATFTGVARVIVNQFACTTNSTATTMVYRSVGPVPPVNDNCSGAYALSTATSCSPVSGTTENATQSLLLFHAMDLQALQVLMFGTLLLLITQPLQLLLLVLQILMPL